MAKLSADIVTLTVCGVLAMTAFCCGVIESVCGPTMSAAIIDTGALSCSCGLIPIANV